MRNALRVDVEDYFHVAAFSQQIDPANWDQFPLRVERNTHRLLDLFAERDVRATFEERLRERLAAPVRLRYPVPGSRSASAVWRSTTGFWSGWGWGWGRMGAKEAGNQALGQIGPLKPGICF